jgi:hypothetical protein
MSGRSFFDQLEAGVGEAFRGPVDVAFQGGHFMVIVGQLALFYRNHYLRHSLFFGEQQLVSQKSIAVFQLIRRGTGESKP